jgi:hypothetical protein
MNHQEWVTRFKSAAELSSDDPAAASVALLALADDSSGPYESSNTEWHRHQALGAAGMYFEEARRPAEALEVYRRTVEFSMAQAAYWARTTADTLAAMALIHFSEGQDAEGIAVSHEALRFLGRAPNGNTLLSRVINELSTRERIAAAEEGT